MTTPAPKVQLTDDEWRKKLTPDEFTVPRQAGTERPFSGEYTDTKTEGVTSAGPAARSCSAAARSSNPIAAGRLSSTRPTLMQ